MESDLIRGLQMALEVAEKHGLPGPGGFNITNRIPTEIFLAIGRDEFESEYELAEATAEAVRNDIAFLIQKLVEDERKQAMSSR